MALQTISARSKQVVNDFKKNEENSFYANVKVLNVSIANSNGWDYLVLRLDKDVDGMVDDAENDDAKVVGKTDKIWLIAGSVAAALRENEEVAFAASFLKSHPKRLIKLLSYAIVDVLCEKVTKDQEYINPFSTKEESDYTIDYDSIYHHVVNIRLSEVGRRYLDGALTDEVCADDID